MNHIVGITDTAEGAGKLYEADKLAALARRCELRYLGKPKEDTFWQPAADCTILTGAWGMVKLTEDHLARLPNLQAVCYAAGTVAPFVTAASWARGIRITTAMYANAIPVAETTVALITLVNKNWFVCQEGARREGHFHAGWRAPKRGNYGVNIGIIGCGAIAREVITRLQLMQHHVFVYDPFLSVEEIAALGATKVDDLLALARQCEVVSLHAPNVPATRGMCDAAFFAAMPDGAHFINTARGALVVEDALLAELQSGRLNALLDVTDPEPPEPGHPFYSLPNCWLTPHRSGSIGNELYRMGDYALREIHALLDGRPFTHEVTAEMVAKMTPA